MHGDFFNEEQKVILQTDLKGRWDRIFSSIPALALKCDSFCFEFYSRVECSMRSTFLELGQGDINSQCHSALRQLNDSDNDYELLVNKSMELTISSHSLLGPIERVLSAAYSETTTRPNSTFVF